MTLSTLRHFATGIFILLSSLPSVRSQVPVKGPQEIFDRAKAAGKPVLLIFSGSDWCLPCIRLEKAILDDSGFVQFAANQLVVFQADFPQKKKLSLEQTTLNEQLAAEFNPQGIFPLLLLIKPDKTAVISLYYLNYSASAFKKQIIDAISSLGMEKELTAKARLMGSAFEFILSAESKQRGEQLLGVCIDEVKRIEMLLTEFSTDSETARINAMAGVQPLRVSQETYQLIERCKHISKLTDGAFDISAVAIRSLYNFRNAHFELPTAEAIKDGLKKTGYQKIQLSHNNQVYLNQAGMRIGFGAIGKGYAADRVKVLMQQQGVSSGVINASGDLTAWGIRPNGQPWKSGIADPEDPSRTILWMPLRGLSIATSGDYEQYFMLRGKRYSHNVDPKTGYPTSGIKSVSVISPSAELSDGLATAVTVMGVRTGLHFIDQLPHTYCLIVDEKNRIYHSKQIDLTTHG
jgi:FAD:protein FMN transferase